MENKQENKDKKEKSAIVRAKNLPISTKHSIAICRFIKGKRISEATKILEKVKSEKIAVPMRGEIPHRKGIMSGRYPVNAAEQFIKILKSLTANALNKNLDTEKITIHAKADTAAKPQRGGRFRRKFKRTNVTIEAM